MKLTVSPQVDKALAYLSDQIHDLPVGMPLPSIGEIRRELGISQLSVQKACDLLELRGRIIRKPRKGIFVSDPTQTGEIAIVVKPEELVPSASPYYALACNALCQVIHEHRPRMEVRMHIGKPAMGRQFVTTLDLTHHDVVPRLRGVFSFVPLEEVGRELEDLGIPVVALGHSFEKYSVSFDSKISSRQYMETLARAGCRSAGILGITTWWDNDASHEWLERGCNAAAAAGLEIRPEWMPVTREVHNLTGRIGYEQFMELWKQPEKPDGIIVIDDITCRGVLQGCLQQGVDLPGDLQLITHANEGVEFYYHKSLTRVEFDAQKQVHHAVEMMFQLLQGREPNERNKIVPGKLILGDTTKNQ